MGALSRIGGLSRHKVKGELSLVKRMRRIKIAADLSLALTSDGTAWGRAVITKYISQMQLGDRCLVEGIMGKKIFNDMMRMKKHAYNHSKPVLAGRMKKYLKAPMIMSRGIIRRSIHFKNGVNNPVRPKFALNDRTRQLQRLIPGGELMNGSCLLREAADYIVSLRTQVQVMHSLAYHSTQTLS